MKNGEWLLTQDYNSQMIQVARRLPTVAWQEAKLLDVAPFSEMQLAAFGQVISDARGAN